MLKCDLPMSPMSASDPLTFCVDWIDCVFSSADTVWVGFSGGVDSHVLLHVLYESLDDNQRQKLAAVHVHHGLSEHADEWLMHCQSVSQDLGVRFVAHRVQLQTQASIEEAARNARYEAFQQTLDVNDVLLLAHHRGDQVETVLFRLLRGTGGKGLSGMPMERALGKSRLIRPFIDVSKDDILRYAELQKLSWVQDESNLDTRFTRNFLRHQVLPRLEEHFPHLEQRIVSSSQRIATDYAMLEVLSEQQLRSWCDQWNGLMLSFLKDKNQEERLFWLKHFLQTKHISLPYPQLENIERMMMGERDKQPEFILPDARIRRHHDVMYVLPADEPVILAPLLEGNWLRRAFDQIRITGLSKSRFCKLQARPQGGELLMGNGQHRKLKKWLNDLSVPNWWRDHLPYIFISEATGDKLVAIGSLWRHPAYAELNIEWQMDARLPFPNNDVA
ncbi:tRNA lysidine(34) synthetase TilS [Marinomonas spartinae]|uniref:tRNA lysidine(34) synthetase TilS n=1 Tax=Marinomonas spartinae TaxID=1792290 RepID=UPI0008352779|nr:tRNA lysidine(34) synthetase TilS [Marinomonas spartinae]